MSYIALRYSLSKWQPVNPQAVQVMLILMRIFTFVMLLCTIVMNMTISLLVFLLMMTFFLLAVGVENETVNKVGGWFGVAACHYGLLVGVGGTIE